MTELASIIGVDNLDIVEVKRLGNSQTTKPRILRVKCGDLMTKQQLLSNAKKLRHHENFKGIYVNPDLTKLQQSYFKKLREELTARRKNKEDVIIRGVKIVRRNSDSQNFQD